MKSDDKIQNEDMIFIKAQVTEFEQRLDILHESIKDMNKAIDMLVRFSMTAKAFMELAISQGIIDPNELNNLASRYETNYSDNLSIPDTDTEYKPKFTNNLY